MWQNLKAVFGLSGSNGRVNADGGISSANQKAASSTISNQAEAALKSSY